MIGKETREKKKKKKKRETKEEKQGYITLKQKGMSNKRKQDEDDCISLMSRFRNRGLHERENCMRFTSAKLGEK
jgi:hypothetical protein